MGLYLKDYNFLGDICLSKNCSGTICPGFICTITTSQKIQNNSSVTVWIFTKLKREGLWLAFTGDTYHGDIWLGSICPGNIFQIRL